MAFCRSPGTDGSAAIGVPAGIQTSDVLVMVVAQLGSYQVPGPGPPGVRTEARLGGTGTYAQAGGDDPPLPEPAQTPGTEDPEEPDEAVAVMVPFDTEPFPIPASVPAAAGRVDTKIARATTPPNETA